MLTGPEFDRLWRQHRRSFRMYAMKFTRGHGPDADDLLQHAAMKAWETRERFEPGTNFLAWVYIILRNRTYSISRRMRGAGASLEVRDATDVQWQMWADSIGFDGAQEATLLLKEMAERIDHMPVAEREALMMGLDASYDEMAERLHRPVGTVKCQVWRIRRRLEAEGFRP